MGATRVVVAWHCWQAQFAVSAARGLHARPHTLVVVGTTALGVTTAPRMQCQDGDKGVVPQEGGSAQPHHQHAGGDQTRAREAHGPMLGVSVRWLSFFRLFFP